MKRVIALIAALSLVAGCGKTAKLANIVETPVEVIEEVKSEAPSVPPAKKGNFLGWTSWDTKALKIATVSVVEFIVIGYFVLRHDTKQRIRYTGANLVKGYIDGVDAGVNIRHLEETKEEHEKNTDYYTLGFDTADKKLLPTPSLYHGENKVALNEALEWDAQHPNHVYQDIEIYHQVIEQE